MSKTRHGFKGLDEGRNVGSRVEERWVLLDEEISDVPAAEFGIT